MARDPYWLECRSNLKCARCGAEIKRGDRAFYFPNTRTLHCEGDDCGGQSARDFEAARFDEGGL